MTFTDISANLTGVYSSSVATADYDGDDDLDLLITGADSNYNISARIYENDGSSGFSEDTNANFTGVYRSSVATGDYDGDSDLDLLITGLDSSNNRIAKIYENDGSGGFTENTSNLIGVYRSSVVWGDYDGDSDLDLLITGRDGIGYRIAKIYENDGSGGFTEDTNAKLTGVISGSVATGDYDGDNDLDLLITGLDSSDNFIAKIYENDGSGGFTENTSANLVGVDSSSVATGDYDGDGDLDLLITGYDSSFNRIAKIYENDGSGGFTENTSANLTGVDSSSVATGDYDGDSDLDLLITGSVGSGNRIAKIYENDGSGGFTENTSANLTGVYRSSVVWGDYDGDGDLDLLITGYDSSSNRIAKIYRNDTPQVVNNTGRDTLEGTASDETLDGGASNDTLGGSLGADSLIGGDGLDRVIYRNSTAGVTVDLLNNSASGGDADGDTFDAVEDLDGSRFDDALTGNSEDNRFYGGKGNDTLVGNDGDDYLSGQNGADSIEGDAGFDRLVGGNGADSIEGGANNDILFGGKGADSITGADTTTNGIGERDRLIGGADADIFVLGTDTTVYYDDGDNTSNGIADYALISDFDATEDTIELSGTQTYFLDVNPVGTSSGTGIFIDSDATAGFSTGDELVGLLTDVTLTAGKITGSTAGFNLV